MQDGDALDPDGVLQSAVQWAASITGANGAAIAVGDASEMRCFASTGNAPTVTATITSTSGLSGICLQTAESVQCDDTETDSRVDAEACRELDLRSVLIVPVFVESKLTALIEVFSSQPRAFDARHKENLARLADSLAVLLAGRDSKAAATPSSTGIEDTAKPGATPASSVLRSSVSTTKMATKAPRGSVGVDAKIVPGTRQSGIAGRTNTGVRSFPLSSRAFSPSQKTGMVAVFLMLLTGLVWYVAGRNHSSTQNQANAGGSLQAKGAAAFAESEITVDQSALSLTAPAEGPSSAGSQASQLAPGKLVHRVEPTYPESARNNGIGGSVVLTATISKTGAMENVKVVRGPDALAEAAADAVRQWVYEPYRRNGEPVAVQTTIIVKFTPANRP